MYDMKSNILVPLRTHYAHLKKLEIFKLEEKFSNSYKAPETPVLTSINHKSAVWEIALANSQTCSMRCDFGAIDQQIYVVMVDALKFYYYWLISSLYEETLRRSNHCVLIKDMPQDYKYKDAADGFANIESPVPLANISAGYVDDRPCLGFTNGVTRTFWLLANGAKSFPVEVYYEDAAKHLYDFAGIGEPPISYQHLQDRHDVITPYNLTNETLKKLKDTGVIKI